MNSLAVISKDVNAVMAMLDAKQKAVALHERMIAWDHLERVHQVSFSERVLIITTVDKESLWELLTDPDTGYEFPNITAWLSCSVLLGCRRANFEALRIGRMLADVPPEKIIDIPKENLHSLVHLSTSVRKQPEVLEAARKLDPSDFDEKIERDYPNQHIERRAPYTIRPGRSERKILDRWTAYAIQHGIAGNATEAIVHAVETCLRDAELDEVLEAMPVPEERHAQRETH